jgi:succinoglycan biosynthesis protein ExoA
MSGAIAPIPATSATPAAPAAVVALVVPVLNEADYIVRCLDSLLAQRAPAGMTVAIIVADGGSTDRTTAIVAEMAAAHPAIRLLRNPRRLQSAAVNLAAREAAQGVGVLLRADAHALYPPDFVVACVDALRESGAQSVVVPMATVGVGGFQRAVAAAQNSRLGNGGSRHRRAGVSGFVEHGHHAAFDRRFFLSIGGYDESFSHNEDAEYDHRAMLAGGRIWMCAGATVTYFPRRDPWALARQYVRHGAGRARTLLTHRIRPRPRQVLPLFILAGVALGLLGAPLFPPLAAIPASYLALCLAWGVVAALRRRDPWLLAMGPAAIIIHLSWAVGFLRACMTWRRRPVPICRADETLVRPPPLA